MLETSPMQIAKSMYPSPSLGRCMRSFYYSNSYMKPIDLKESIKASACPDQSLVTAAQKLMSNPEVQQILSEPLTYDIKSLAERNDVFKKYNFRILGSIHTQTAQGVIKVEHYKVSEHDDLSGWIIKTGGLRGKGDQILSGTKSEQNENIIYEPEDSLLRLAMNQRINKVAKEIGVEVTTPVEYAIPYEDQTKGHFIISQKLDVLTPVDSYAAINKKTSQEQIQLAQNIGKLVSRIGYAEAMSICLTKDDKLAILDTKPAGLLVNKDGAHKKGQSVERQARIGLNTMKLLAKQTGTDVVAREFDKQYKASLKKVSVKKVILSILCPLVAVAILIMSIVRLIQIRLVQVKLSKNFELDNTAIAQSINNPIEFAKNMQKKNKPKIERYYSLINNIPF